MEKSKKKEIKKEAPVKKTNNKVVFGKESKKIINILAWIMSFLASILCIFTFVFSIITSLKVANSEKTDILHDNFTVTYISNINSISITETEDLIQGYGSKALFIIYDIVIPTVALIAITILLVILLKNILDFVASSSREKDLYTVKKLHDIERMACFTEAIITISFVTFYRPSLLIYIFISLLLFIIIGLFKKCVDNKNSH